MQTHLKSFIEFKLILNEPEKQPYGAELFFIASILKILANVLEKKKLAAKVVFSTVAN